MSKTNGSRDNHYTLAEWKEQERREKSDGFRIGAGNAKFTFQRWTDAEEHIYQEKKKTRILIAMLLFALICFFLGILFDHYSADLDKFTLSQVIQTPSNHITIDTMPTPIPGQK